MAPLEPVKLRRTDLPADTVELARYLIGKRLVHDRPEGRMMGRIVETEAYLVGDAAAHSFRGKTKRNQTLFLERGHAYVYVGYGIWKLLNVSSETEGVGAGVLLRAMEPLEGIALMRERRGETAPVEALARGPGLLTVAMGVGMELNGIDLCADGPLWLAPDNRETGKIGVSIRIGITKDADRMLRFYERGNPCVSGGKRLNA